MPHRRPRKRGSFGSHFDELVEQFPHEPKTPQTDQSSERTAQFQERIDIHRALFERAWQMEDGADQRPATNSQMSKAKSPAAGGS